MEKTTYRGALYPALLAKYYLGDKIKKNEIGGTYSMYGREERCRQES
jgi:hypothetical protein